MATYKETIDSKKEFTHRVTVTLDVQSDDKDRPTTAEFLTSLLGLLKHLTLNKTEVDDELNRYVHDNDISENKEDSSDGHDMPF